MNRYMFRYGITFIVLLLLGALYLLGCKVRGFVAQGHELCSMILVITLFIAAVNDYKTHKIPNWLTYPAFCAVFTVWLILDFAGIEKALLGAAVCFGIVLVPYLLHQGGAGDVKLAAVVGAALGFQDGFAVITLGYAVAATLVVIGIVWDKGIILLFKSFYHRIGNWFVPLWILPPDGDEKNLLQKPIPLAPCFCVAGLFVLCGGLTLMLPK